MELMESHLGEIESILANSQILMKNQVALEMELESNGLVAESMAMKFEQDWTRLHHYFELQTNDLDCYLLVVME